MSDILKSWWKRRERHLHTIPSWTLGSSLSLLLQEAACPPQYSTGTSASVRDKAVKQKHGIGERNDSCRETKASCFREVLSTLKAFFLFTAKCSVTSTPEPAAIQDIWHVQQLTSGGFRIPTTFVGLPLCAEHTCKSPNTSNSLGQSRWDGQQEAGRLLSVWLLTASAEPRGRDGAVWSPPWACWGHKGPSGFGMREGRKPWSLPRTSLSRPLSLTS